MTFKAYDFDIKFTFNYDVISLLCVWWKVVKIMSQNRIFTADIFEVIRLISAV